MSERRLIVVTVATLIVAGVAAVWGIVRAERDDAAREHARPCSDYADTVLQLVPARCLPGWKP